MKLKLLVAAFVAAFSATLAFADKVTLKSGSYLLGEAGLFKDGKLQFKSQDLGDVEIAIDAIAKLEASGNHTVQYNDLSTEQKPVTVVDGAYALEGKPMDMSNVKRIDPEEDTWHGSFNLSGAAVRGNTVSESVTVLADVSRRWENDRFTGAGGYYFAQSGDSKQTKRKSANRFEVQGQFDHFWGPAFYNYVNAKYELDRIMELDYRFRLGAGFGYQWLEGKEFSLGKISFNQELGLAYVTEKYEHKSSADDYASVRYAHHLIWDTNIENLQFTHNFELLPNLNYILDDYIVDTDVGFSYMFLPNWQLLGKLEWDYKRKTAAGVKHSDLRYMLGIGYKW